ncbi:caspase family protein [Candidatus Poribacteria bacterium]|nr:caspase family protein [Candidatus Poribacteria bacterium]
MVIEETTSGESWAIIVGINEYPSNSGFSPLSYAVRDAQAIENLLVDRFGFKRQNIYQFYNQQAKKQDLLRAFDELQKKVKKEDRLLVFYAGHGQDEEEPDSPPQGYLIPVAGDKNHFSSTCIPMRDSGLHADRIRAKHIFFILDACFGGIAGYQARQSVGILSADRGRQIMTAGSADETVQEGKNWDNHGIYTYYLLKGLEGEADTNQDQLITLYELQAYLNNGVTTDLNKAQKQTPQLRFLSGDGYFVFQR